MSLPEGQVPVHSCRPDFWMGHGHCVGMIAMYVELLGWPVADDLLPVCVMGELADGNIRRWLAVQVGHWTLSILGRS